MTTNGIAKFVLVAIIAVARFSIVSGQISPASAPEPAEEDCFTVIISAADCFPYIENDSNLTVPDKGCCPEVKSIVNNHLACICQVIGQAADYNINVSRGLQLPLVCNIKIPSVTLCPNLSWYQGSSLLLRHRNPARENCTVEIFSAADCLNFIENDSNLTAPDKRCCPEVKNLVTDHPACICPFIGLAADYNVNLSKALMLPTVCKVQIPIPRLCPISPGAAPSGILPPTPGSNPGLASSPTAGGGSNGASGGAVRSVLYLATALGVAILPIFF